MLSFIICALLIIAIVALLIFGHLLNDAYNDWVDDDDENM